MSKSKKNLDTIAGRRINKNIYNSHHALLLPAASLINEKVIRVLADHQIQLSDEDLEPSPSQRSMEQIVDQSVLEVKQIFAEIEHTGHIPFDKIKQTILPTLCGLSKDFGLIGFMLNLQKADDYTYRHSAGVSMMAAMIGGWLNLPEAEISRLAMAGLLHDLGKLYISPTILQKPGRLDPEEYEEIKRHPQLGYDCLMRQPDVDERVALVALQHHEREDGSGYPFGIIGLKMDLMSKIVAIADVFHAMTSQRLYRKELPLYEVLRKMWLHAYGAMDPHILHCFMEKLMIFLIGCEVLLSDGRTGRIVLLNDRNPVNPLVETQAGFIDLSKEPALFIEKLMKV
ncbi:HD-GYP domain-containing protein [Paenibacillus agricola]|uniref:HD-GYP domain-containing protein n=1 Tax=Paenibacillus agricola TaxID=2716264 RepID=A0ABX0J9D7_9BACL|nr:HD-GYP domain-containing protein [Paenibacillus agricola]NHN31921.1 HD-GYP domain-containing protein [Paenibacillus agricola]